MGLTARRYGCASLAGRWTLVALLASACGSPDRHTPEAAQSSSASEETDPVPSDLLLRLGGQTGSEMAQGAPACPARLTNYALSDVTPLGFAATALVDSVAAFEYSASGIGLGEGPSRVRVELTAPVTFIDRDPSPDSELVCIDAVRAGAVFEVWVEEQPVLLHVAALYAEAVDRFAGQSDALKAAALPEALEDAAGGAEVYAVVESLGAGAVVWFQRRLATGELELLGTVAPER